MKISEIKKKFNLPIIGGKGKSKDDPIIIDKKAIKNYIKLEYFIVSKLLEINDNNNYQRVTQKLLKHNNKVIDYLKIKVSNNCTSQVNYEDFYFDISNVY